MFDQREPIDLPLEAPPHLIVVVDTEEEFDWQAEPDPDASRVTAMARIDRVQNIFREYGICPCYVIDYPIANQPLGHTVLRRLVERGECEIGAHLHP